MVKKFLALLATLSVLTTSTAMAVDYVPNGTGNITDIVTSLTVTPSTINPLLGEHATVTYTLASASTTHVYVLNDQFSVVATLSPKAMATVGSHSLTWNGTVGNIANGLALANGNYSVRIFAYDVNNNVVDYDFAVVTLGSTTPPPSLGPDVTNLTAVPNSIDAGVDTTTISFSVNQAANLDVEVKQGTTLVKQFASYDGSVLYPVGTQSMTWDGKNNAGNVVSNGTYTVSVTATNSNGSDTETVNVTVNDVVVSNGVIENFKLYPSNTWDPSEDDELEIEFDLTADVDNLRITAEKGSKTIEILDEDYTDANDYSEVWDGTDEDGDEVAQGVWEIVVEADNSRAVRTINIQYETPTIVEAFVTKTSFDNTIGEVTNLVFKVDTDAVVTVELYDGSKRLVKLMDDEDVSKNKWYSIEWDGTDDGDEVDEGTNYEFRIRAEHLTDSNVYDSANVTVSVKEDTVSSSKSNATNDYTAPVVYDDTVDASVKFSYCMDEDADVYLAVYDGFSTSGSAEVELLDYVSQTAGCHEVVWDVKDGTKKMKDNVYSYKLITRADGGSKDTETGRFVVGNIEGTVGPKPPTPPNPTQGECTEYYWDVATVSPQTCEAISWTTQAGIFEGNPDGSFAPYRAINRAETLAVTLRAFSDSVTMFPANGSNLGFLDVNVNAWYMTYLRTGKYYGMIHGFINNTEARPEQSIIRVEFLKFALEASDAFTSYEIPGFESSVYADVVRSFPGNVWYYDYAGVANQYGLYDTAFDSATGLQFLEPTKLVQRGEVALVLYRMHLAGLLD